MYLTHICISCCFLIQASFLIAQKPKVQVEFTVAPGNLFYETFEDSIDEISSSALSVLIKGLNDYIGFAEFTEDSCPNRLKISLDNKMVGSTGFIQEFWLFFELLDETGGTYSNEWEFLDFDEFISYRNDVSGLLLKLEEDWENYLRKSYNQELVTNLFENIALPIPDHNHYYVDDISGIREAILPFKKEVLMMDPEKSEFRVVVHGETSSGVPTQATQEEVHYTGPVHESMVGIPSPLKGCIRIGLKSLPLMQLLNGQVYITDYHRKIYNTNMPTDDFLGTHPE